MARFAVHRERTGDQLLLDCQAERLSHLRTRFVVPLLPVAAVSDRVGRMHPEFEIGDSVLVMATHLASAVPATELGRVVADLAEEHDRIVDALDVLIGTA